MIYFHKKNFKTITLSGFQLSNKEFNKINAQQFDFEDMLPSQTNTIF